MSAPLRLIVFDVDGTLIDSQAHIVASMSQAFAAEGLEPPQRQDVLALVGLSLDLIMPRLAPMQSPEVHNALVRHYKDAFADLRMQQGADHASPLYPGAREALQRLNAQPEWLLGVATGKSQRGLDAVLDAHDLRSFFVTTQVADHHPSKPHPAMLEAALRDAGVPSSDAIMIGDTQFDQAMANAAGVPFIAVPWGYHPVSEMSGARAVLDHFNDLPGLLADIWSAT